MPNGAASDAQRSSRAGSNAASLLLKNLAFTVLVPGTVAGIVPRSILAGSGQLSPAGTDLRFLGWVPVSCGIALYGWCVWNFATSGRGTPAPIDAPKALVIGGPYRYTRNPMYVAVLGVILGEAILFLSARLLMYATIVAAMFQAFITCYEEPALLRKFGADYEGYCARVPRWWKRVRPMEPRN